MPYFSIDPTKQNGAGCATCCCEPASALPGSIDKWVLDFAEWAVPVGGKGLSESAFVIEKLYDAPRRIEVTNGAANTPINTNATFDASTLVTGNPDGLALKYSLLPFDTFSHGTSSIDKNTGIISYSPLNGFTGYDRGFVAITPDSGSPVVVEVVFSVNPASGNLPAPKFTPELSVPGDRVHAYSGQYAIEFALVTSPAVSVGDIFRLSVKQTALDCDCKPFTHVSCYDIKIGKC